MILKGLKRRSNQIFFNKNYESFIKNSRKIAPKNLQRVLLISDDCTHLEAVTTALEANLGILSSQITLVLFQDQKDAKNNVDYCLSDRDFGWYGKVEEGYLKEVLTNTYDLLINHSKVENLYTDLLVLQVKADLKVGLGTLNSDNYDLLIQCEASNAALFTSELKKYLEILK